MALPWDPQALIMARHKSLNVATAHHLTAHWISTTGAVTWPCSMLLSLPVTGLLHVAADIQPHHPMPSRTASHVTTLRMAETGHLLHHYERGHLLDRQAGLLAYPWH